MGQVGPALPLPDFGRFRAAWAHWVPPNGTSGNGLFRREESRSIAELVYLAGISVLHFLLAPFPYQDRAGPSQAAGQLNWIPGVTHNPPVMRKKVALRPKCVAWGPAFVASTTDPQEKLGEIKRGGVVARGLGPWATTITPARNLGFGSTRFQRALSTWRLGQTPP